MKTTEHTFVYVLHLHYHLTLAWMSVCKLYFQKWQQLWLKKKKKNFTTPSTVLAWLKNTGMVHQSIYPFPLIHPFIHPSSPFIHRFPPSPLSLPSTPSIPSFHSFLPFLSSIPFFLPSNHWWGTAGLALHDTVGLNTGGWLTMFCMSFCIVGQCRWTVWVLLLCIDMAYKRTSKQLVECSRSGLSIQASTPTNGW